MKTKLVIAAIAGALVMLVPATNALAHPGTWYWSAQKAANKIYKNNLQWTSGEDTVTYVRCTGTGERYRGLHKHFRCYVEAIEDEPYFVKLHVLGRQGWTYNFLRYA
jgi:hypothetical protein